MVILWVSLYASLLNGAFSLTEWEGRSRRMYRISWQEMQARELARYVSHHRYLYTSHHFIGSFRSLLGGDGQQLHATKYVVSAQ